MTAGAARVYVLHFGRAYHHARHYVGIALDGDVHRRFVEHLYGHGSPLVRAVVAAGIDVQVVLDVPGDRGLERRMHNRHRSRLCPICRNERPLRPRQLRLFPRRGHTRPGASRRLLSGVRV